jgi:hypothetical protein
MTNAVTWSESGDPASKLISSSTTIEVDVEVGGEIILSYSHAVMHGVPSLENPVFETKLINSKTDRNGHLFNRSPAGSSSLRRPSRRPAAA